VVTLCSCGLAERREGIGGFYRQRDLVRGLGFGELGADRTASVSTVSGAVSSEARKMTGRPRLSVAETAGRRTASGAGGLLGWAGFPAWAGWLARGPFLFF
jgi:hypothetical protein